jgi:hypothetical protein
LDAALGEGPPETALRVQRANVLAAIRRGRRPWGQPRWEAGIGVAAAVAVALAIALWPASPAPLQARWQNGVRLASTAVIAAGERSESIEFSDGSRLVLEPKARARMRLDPNHTELALNAGKLVASVRHREGASWSIMAGPYEVRVVGTRFSVRWDQASQTLNVEVSEGLVRVSGGDLGARAVELASGQQLERQISRPSAEAAPAAPTTTAAPLVPTPPVAAAPASSAPNRTLPPAPPGVSELAQAGKYREALELAEQHGFERVIGELPEGELLALGNAARYAGSAARARQAMLTLRNRFPGRPAAELGALYLAKIAEQLDRSPPEAARWLRVFLSESPTGSLAADARASLLSILLSSGDTAGATAVARDYLKYHPTGPIADRARVLVSRSEGK